MMLGNCQCRFVLLSWTFVGQGLQCFQYVQDRTVLDVFFSRLLFLIFILPLSGKRSDVDGNYVLKGHSFSSSSFPGGRYKVKFFLTGPLSQNYQIINHGL